MAESDNRKSGKQKTVITAVTPGSVASQRIHSQHGTSTQKRIVLSGTSSKKILSSVDNLEAEEGVSDVQPAIVGAEAEADVNSVEESASHKTPLLIAVVIVAVVAIIGLIAFMLMGDKGPSLADQAAAIKGGKRTAAGVVPPAKTTAKSIATTKPAVFMSKGLIGHWTFDGDMQDHGSKKMTSRYDGTASFVPGVHGQAIKFDGSHAVEVENHPLVEKINRFYTLSAWIRLPKDERPTNFGGIITRGDQCWRMSSGGWETSASLHFGQNAGKAKHMVIYGQRKDLNDGEWHHVVAVRNDTHILTFVDGVRDGSKNEAVDDLQLSTAPIWIGGNSDFYADPSRPARKTRNFKGEVDDVRLYIRALTEVEAQELFKHGHKP